PGSGQVKPASSVHVSVQPSFAALEPSSHSSAGPRKPLPQMSQRLRRDPEGSSQTQSCSTSHVALQPSPFCVLPSSQASPAAVSRMALPHLKQGPPSARQVHPSSGLHSLLQPSRS